MILECLAGLTAVLTVPWVLAASTPWALRRLPDVFDPAVEIVLLPVAAAIVALATAASLTALGSILLVIGHTACTLAGVLCLAGPVWGIGRVGVHLLRVRSNARAVLPLTKSAARIGDVVRIVDDVPDAFATPAGGGTVVITTAMIDALSPAELDALIAHERAHLRFHHAQWIQLAECAAALNPLLRAAATSARHAAERHADERAAASNRVTVMNAVARAALVSTRYRRENVAVGMASTGGDVVRRVHALSDPPPAPTRRPALAAAVISLMLVLGIALALEDIAQDSFFPEPGESLTQIFR